MKVLFSQASPIFADNYKRHLGACGIEYVDDASSGTCNFSACIDETHLADVRDHCESTGTPTQNYAILDKLAVYQACASVGMQTLKAFELQSADDLAQLDGKPFILKPRLGLGSVGKSPFAYRIFKTRSEFETAVEGAPGFWATQVGPVEDRLLAQEAVTIDGQVPTLVLVEGVVNGNGDVVLNEINESFQTGSIPTSTCLDGLPDSDKSQLKAQVTAFIKTANVRNTFFHMQLIRYQSEATYPIDFNYRLDYQTLFGPTTGRLKQMLEFAYDVRGTVDAGQSEFGCVTTADINVHYLGLAELMAAKGIVAPFNSIRPYKFRRLPNKQLVQLYAWAATREQAGTTLDQFIAGIV